MKHRIAIALIGMCMVLPRGSAPAYAQGADAEEIRLGQVYARRLESQYRLVQEAGGLERGWRDAAMRAGEQVVRVCLLSGCSRDLERDAELTAIAYLVKTPYTPVGELTLMERLAREEQLSPRVDPGALRDHPTARERVDYIEADLKRRDIPIVRRVTANYLRVTFLTSAVQTERVGEILVNNSFILLLPDPARVGTVVARLEQFFDTDPDPSEVAALRTRDGWDIVGGRMLLMTLTRADAEF